MTSSGGRDLGDLHPTSMAAAPLVGDPESQAEAQEWMNTGQITSGLHPHVVIKKKKKINGKECLTNLFLSQMEAQGGQ